MKIEDISASFEILVQNGPVMATFAARDRARLIDLTADICQNVLANKCPFPQLHFALPDNVIFLRLHKLGRLSDDLSEEREAVVAANKERTGEGFRDRQRRPGTAGGEELLRAINDCMMTRTSKPRRGGRH